MRSVHVAVLLSTLPAFAFGCAHEYEVRGASHQAYEAQAEAHWLREEVQSLRASLAERDRREAEMWRAYVDLAQRIGTLQAASERTKPVEPTASMTASQSISAQSECTPPAATTEALPRRSVSRAINQSRLTVREKRQLLQSMRPPRVIDVVNPWEAER